jgi:hypothetical protein
VVERWLDPMFQGQLVLFRIARLAIDAPILEFAASAQRLE